MDIILPEDILDIVHKYIHQLKMVEVFSELKARVHYEFISPHFSEVIYCMKKPRIISYYYNGSNLLIMHKNDIFNKYIINKETNINILEYK